MTEHLGRVSLIKIMNVESSGDPRLANCVRVLKQDLDYMENKNLLGPEGIKKMEETRREYYRLKALQDKVRGDG